MLFMFLWVIYELAERSRFLALHYRRRVLLMPEQCHLQVIVAIEFLLLLGIPRDIYTEK